MNRYILFSAIIWTVSILTIVTGVFWWIPAYVPNYAQDNTTEWVLSITTIVAVGLNIGNELYNGERSIRIFTLLALSIITVIVALFFVQWYIPKYVEKQQQTRQQQIALILMNILLTVYDIGSSIVHDIYDDHVQITGGRHRK